MRTSQAPHCPRRSRSAMRSTSIPLTFSARRRCLHRSSVVIPGLHPRPRRLRPLFRPGRLPLLLLRRHPPPVPSQLRRPGLPAPPIPDRSQALPPTVARRCRSTPLSSGIAAAEARGSRSTLAAWAVALLALFGAAFFAERLLEPQGSTHVEVIGGGPSVAANTPATKPASGATSAAATSLQPPPGPRPCSGQDCPGGARRQRLSDLQRDPRTGPRHGAQPGARRGRS